MIGKPYAAHKWICVSDSKKERGLYVRRYTYPDGDCTYQFRFREGLPPFDFENDIKKVTVNKKGNVVLHIRKRKKK